MDNTQKWINEFNNFKAIYTGQPKEDVLFHSCDLKALKGICLHQYLFATDLIVFKDPNEGKLSLSKLDKLDLPFTDNQKGYLANHIRGDELTEILKKFPVYVCCTSRQSNQDFFFNGFHSNAIEKGADYQLEFKTNALCDHLWIETGCGRKRNDCLRFGNIIYDESEQQKILREELSSFWNLISKDNAMPDEAKVDYLIRKCHLLGTFFKRPNSEARVSADEKEFRIAVNTFSNDYVQGDISGLLPQGDERHHIFLYFTDDFISKITAKDQKTFDELLKDSVVGSFVKKHDIQVEIW